MFKSPASGSGWSLFLLRSQWKFGIARVEQVVTRWAFQLLPRLSDYPFWWIDTIIKSWSCAHKVGIHLQLGELQWPLKWLQFDCSFLSCLKDNPSYMTSWLVQNQRLLKAIFHPAMIFQFQFLCGKICPYPYFLVNTTLLPSPCFLHPDF